MFGIYSSMSRMRYRSMLEDPERNEDLEITTHSLAIGYDPMIQYVSMSEKVLRTAPARSHASMSG
jgi:hypothetical protein